MRRSEEWFTPLYIIEALGKFDLDPCTSIVRPFDTAKHHFALNYNGLKSPWAGRVWCNPPFGMGIKPWLAKCVLHKNVIALIPASTETKFFFDYVWEKGVGMLFLESRIRFLNSDGRIAKGTFQKGIVLVAYDKKNARILQKCKLPGAYIQGRKFKNGGKVGQKSFIY